MCVCVCVCAYVCVRACVCPYPAKLERVCDTIRSPSVCTGYFTIF